MRAGDPCDGIAAAGGGFGAGLALALGSSGGPDSPSAFGFAGGCGLALGGTLRRDTSANDTLIRHHAPDDVDFDAMFDHRHPVELADGGMLSTAYAKGALDVNSVHFQGIGTLADGLTVEARAPDGLIEAYSARPNGAPLLAVQWHPEWGTENDADSQTYFHLLGKALRGEL